MRTIRATAGGMIVALMIAGGAPGSPENPNAQKKNQNTQKKSETAEKDVRARPAPTDSATAPVPQPATSTQYVKAEAPRYDPEREAQIDHLRHQVDSLVVNVEQLRTLDDAFRWIGGGALLFSFLSLLIAGWAVKEIRDARREIRDFQTGLFPQLGRMQGAIDRLRPREKPGGEADSDSGQFNTSSGVMRGDDEPADMRTNVPRRAASGSRHQKPTTDLRRMPVSVDESLMLQLGAACLNFPHSIDEFRRAWTDRGGDGGVEILGYPDHSDPSVIVVNSAGALMAVPNTTDWERLSRTHFFDADGPVVPGTRVRELLEVARGRSSRHGEPRIDQKGRVRVDI